VELVVELTDFNDTSINISFANFKIADASTYYHITHDGSNSTYALSMANNHPFSTFDNDHDTCPDSNCAERYSGAWWYSCCHGSNLNALYLRGSHENYATGMSWSSFGGHYYSLKATVMKIRGVE